MFTALKDFDFALLDSGEFKEDAVREEIVSPILKELGYSAGGLNRIVRSRSLSHPFVKIGSQERPVTIIPDYLLLAANKPAWILDAKAPGEPVTSGGHVEQAYSYAIHPDINSRYFALCNGREFALRHGSLLVALGSSVIRTNVGRGCQGLLQMNSTTVRNDLNSPK